MPSLAQVLARARKASRQSRPRSLRVPPETLRLVTWQRMSFSEPLVCNGISGRSSWAATIILAGQRQLSWPVGSPANAGCREGRSLDRRPALAGDGGFKIPWRGCPPFGVEGGIAAHLTNRMSLDAEPSCDRPPGDALHDPFPTTRP